MRGRDSIIGFEILFHTSVDMFHDMTRERVSHMCAQQNFWLDLTRMSFVIQNSVVFRTWSVIKTLILHTFFCDKYVKKKDKTNLDSYVIQIIMKCVTRNNMSSKVSSEAEKQTNFHSFFCSMSK